MWTRTTARGMENEPENRLGILKSCDRGSGHWSSLSNISQPNKHVLVQSPTTPRPGCPIDVSLTSHSLSRVTTHDESHDSRLSHYSRLIIIITTPSCSSSSSSSSSCFLAWLVLGGGGRHSSSPSPLPRPPFLPLLDPTENRTLLYLNLHQNQSARLSTECF